MWCPARYRLALFLVPVNTVMFRGQRALCSLADAQDGKPPVSSRAFPQPRPSRLGLLYFAFGERLVCLEGQARRVFAVQ